MTDPAPVFGVVPQRLGIARTLGDTLRFYGRHVVAFYLLGMMTSLSGYAFESLDSGTFLSAIWWTFLFSVIITDVAIIGLVMAIMARVRMHDRRGDRKALLQSIFGAVRGLAAVFSLSFTYALAVLLAFALLVVTAEARLFGLIPFLLILLLIAFAVLTILFCSAVSVAAVEGRGFIACFRRSAALLEGNRWRVLAILLLALLPLALAFVLLRVMALPLLGPVDPFPPWHPFVFGILKPFCLALPVMVYEILVVQKDGPDPQCTAAVFD